MRTTRFIDVPTMALLVQRVGLAAFLRQLVEALREDFQRWPEIQAVPRLAVHSTEGVIELMPAADARHYGVKLVNGHPHNPALGLPTVLACGLLLDSATGAPLLLSEMTLATALRTAATSALAASVLARPGSRRMALIGNGAQSEFQALAFHLLLGIDELVVYDLDPHATAKLLRNLRPWPALKVMTAPSVREAVHRADIVTTLTAARRRAAVLQPGWIEAGQHLNAVGGDCPGKTELDPALLSDPHLHLRVVVEQEAQTRVEGEIQQQPGLHVTELWRILAGQAPSRQLPGEVTLFDSVGFALEDFTTLRLIHRLSRELGLGQDIALVPSGNRDPKDLFGLLHAAG